MADSKLTIAAWLAQYNHNDLLSAFKAAGCEQRTLHEFAADARDAQARIDDILTGQSDDVKAALGDAWEDAVAKEDGGAQGSTLSTWKPSAKDIPAPPGPPIVPTSDPPKGATLDLSDPELSYTIPTSIPPTSGPTPQWPTPAQLSQRQLMFLAKGNSLNRGLVYDNLIKRDPPNIFADQVAFCWVVDELIQLNVSTDEEEADCIEETHNLKQSNVFETSASGTYEFVSGAASVSVSTLSAQATSTKQFFVSVKLRFPMCILPLGNWLWPRQQFLDELRAAIFISGESSDQGPSLAEKFANLQKVFARYGDVMPGSVTLGAQVTGSFRKVASAMATDYQSTFKAAADVKLSGEDPDKANGPSFSFKIGNTNAKEDVYTVKRAFQETDWKFEGGDITDQGDIGKWKGTVGDPNKWAVIYRDGLKSILDFVGIDGMPPSDPRYEENKRLLSFRTQVKDVWTAASRAAWNGSKVLIDPDWVVPDASYFPLPHFWDTVSGKSIDVQVAASSSGDLYGLGAYDGAAADPGPNDAKDIHSWLGTEQDTPLEVGKWGRATGSLYTYQDPAPVRIDQSKFAEVGANKLNWNFVYSGRVGLGGHPLYWIATPDGTLLSAFTDTSKGEKSVQYWVNLLPVTEKSRKDIGNSAALWSLHPADPSGWRQQDGKPLFAGLWLIRNNSTNGFLGPVFTLTCRRRVHMKQSPTFGSYSEDDVEYTPVTRLRTRIDHYVPATTPPGDPLGRIGASELQDLADTTFAAYCWSIGDLSKPVHAAQ